MTLLVQRDEKLLPVQGEVEIQGYNWLPEVSTSPTQWLGALQTSLERTPLHALNVHISPK